jgi:hypothetical protein
MSSAGGTTGWLSSTKAQRRLGIGVRLLVAVILIVFSIFRVLWVVSASLNQDSRVWQLPHPADPGRVPVLALVLEFDQSGWD